MSRRRSRRTWTSAVCAWVCIAGCTPTALPSARDEPEADVALEVPRADTPVTAQDRPVVAHDGPLEIAWGKQHKRPSDFRPSRVPGMTDEPYAYGWSAATGEFAYCVPGGGLDCDRCTFTSSSGASQTVYEGSECEGEMMPSGPAKARFDAGDFRITDGDWAFGSAVVLVAQERRGPPDGDGNARGVVRLGVRMREGHGGTTAPTTWVERLERCDDDWCASDFHIDVIAPSPDGQTIALLAHSFMGEYTDGYHLVMLDADQLAERASRALEPAR